LFNDSIKKMWDLDVSGLECVIIVPKDCFNDDTARWLKSKWLYDSRVTYLAGDIMNEEDARRTSLKTAKALFLIPEINGGDDDTVIRAVSYEICTCIFICLFLINNNLHCLSTVVKHWHSSPPPPSSSQTPKGTCTTNVWKSSAVVCYVTFQKVAKSINTFKNTKTSYPMLRCNQISFNSCCCKSSWIHKFIIESIILQYVINIIIIIIIIFIAAVVVVVI
jgi:hypothetical protein